MYLLGLELRRGGDESLLPRGDASAVDRFPPSLNFRSGGLARWGCCCCCCCCCCCSWLEAADEDGGGFVGFFSADLSLRCVAGGGDVDDPLLGSMGQW